MNQQKPKSKRPVAKQHTKGRTEPKGATPSVTSNAVLSATPGALLEAVASVLAPLVRLLIARGVTYQAANEMLKRVYVRAGQKHFNQETTRGQTTGTQLSLITGLNRKEIRRLTDEALQSAAPESVTSFAAAVHAAWLTQRRFCERSGAPRVLPQRTKGKHPSFGDLVRSVTTDHRPAALLEELRRLELADVNEQGDVVLRVQPFLPRRSAQDRLSPLAENLADHASAGVSNVLANEPPYLDRYLFSDALSEESVAHLQQLARDKWAQIHDDLIKEAVRHEAADSAAGRTTDYRIRVGMYFYSEQQQKAQENKEDE